MIWVLSVFVFNHTDHKSYTIDRPVPELMSCVDLAKYTKEELRLSLQGQYSIVVKCKQEKAKVA